MPGRDAVALLLEASMKNEGWTGGRLAEQRRQLEEKDSRRSSRKSASAGIGKQLNLDPRSLSMYSSDTESEGEEEEADDTIYVNFDQLMPDGLELTTFTDTQAGFLEHAGVLAAFTSRSL